MLILIYVDDPMPVYSIRLFFYQLISIKLLAAVLEHLEGFGC